MFKLVVIGGGAAGFFSALAAKEANPRISVAIFEKTAVLLSKVRISGGGRCNVTHACFDPRILAQNYPRGSKELIAPFHQFQPRDTIDWFEKRGALLKVEKDGRIFPQTDDSETIIGCLQSEAKKTGVEIFLRQKIQSITKEKELFNVVLQDGKTILSDAVILATGSSSEGYKFAQELGHTIHHPVPSLFTFNVPTSPLKDLSGISFDQVTVSIKDAKLSQTGPFLITHFGFSGPAVLKLSAFGARYFFEKNYKTEISINWLPDLSFDEIHKTLLDMKKSFPQKRLLPENPFRFPKNFWFHLIKESHLDKRLNEISHKEIHAFSQNLHAQTFLVDGKTTNKEEFVTCGGVSLKEIDFKKMESKIIPNLFFAGEILDIDGITGGFNFQNAWTTGYIAGNSIL